MLKTQMQKTMSDEHGSRDGDSETIPDEGTNDPLNPLNIDVRPKKVSDHDTTVTSVINQIKNLTLYGNMNVGRMRAITSAAGYCMFHSKDVHLIEPTWTPDPLKYKRSNDCLFSVTFTCYGTCTGDRLKLCKQCNNCGSKFKNKVVELLEKFKDKLQDLQRVVTVTQRSNGNYCMEAIFAPEAHKIQLESKFSLIFKETKNIEKTITTNMAYLNIDIGNSEELHEIFLNAFDPQMIGLTFSGTYLDVLVTIYQWKQNISDIQVVASTNFREPFVLLQDEREENKLKQKALDRINIDKRRLLLYLWSFMGELNNDNDGKFHFSITCLLPYLFTATRRLTIFG